MHHVPVRSKLGPASKQQLKFLSKGARRVLSILFLAGVFFFAILSFTTYVRDTDTNDVKSAAQVGASRLRRALTTGVQDVDRVLHRSRGAAGPLRIMLASHNRLFWLHTDTGNTTVLHERGVSRAVRRTSAGPMYIGASACSEHAAATRGVSATGCALRSVSRGTPPQRRPQDGLERGTAAQLAPGN
jgi:hypothetical protein